MKSSHNAKRQRLLKRIAIHGDEGKAAGSLGMSRNQLMKLNDPKIRQQIELEKESVRDEGDWRGIIFRAKVLPHIGNTIQGDFLRFAGVWTFPASRSFLREHLRDS